jgi:hypothetical protein
LQSAGGVGTAVGMVSARAVTTGGARAATTAKASSGTRSRDPREHAAVRLVGAARHRVGKGIVKADAGVAGCCAWPARAFVLGVTPLGIRTQAREEGDEARVSSDRDKRKQKREMRNEKRKQKEKQKQK